MNTQFFSATVNTEQKSQIFNTLIFSVQWTRSIFRNGLDFSILSTGSIIQLQLSFDVIYVCLQVKKDLTGTPLKEAVDDLTLPFCWKGKKPFKSTREIRKYFKPIALNFANGWRAKTQYNFPPESYLIISVSAFHDMIFIFISILPRYVTL